MAQGELSEEELERVYKNDKYLEFSMGCDEGSPIRR
jgi:hypothetical protein